MIEMLGVLAIIGVLSAGGIMGYSAAMDAYTFNKFVKDTQTAVSTATSVFPKLHNYTDSVFWYGQTLNKLGILPDDLYKTAPNPTSSHVKNPFTGKVDWAFNLVEYNETATGTHQSNMGDVHYKPHKNTFIFYQLYVPKKICIKMLTFDWGGIAPDGAFVISRTHHNDYLYFKPATVAEAEIACNYESNFMQFDFFIHAALYIKQFAR